MTVCYDPRPLVGYKRELTDEIIEGNKIQSY